MSEKNRSIILVPVDFTPVADSAINYALEIAKLFKNEIYLLHIVESGLLESASSKEKHMAEATAQLTAKATDAATRGGVKVTPLVKQGSIFETIGATADELDTNLVVMGTHGVKGLQFITGSRAIKVISSSRAPFVVVQNKPLGAQGFKNILLPMDFTAETKTKLPWAVYMAKNFNATLHIFVQHFSDQFLQNSVNNNVAFAERYLKQNDVSYAIHHDDESGDFARHTIRFASAQNADLIVIMTQQDRDNLSDYILGPDDQRVVANDAQIPVMCVNPFFDKTVQGSILDIG